MVKATAVPHAHEVENEKHHAHHSHSVNGEKNVDGENVVVDVFRWSRCKKPLPQKMMKSYGIPLPLEHVEVVAHLITFTHLVSLQLGI